MREPFPSLRLSEIADLERGRFSARPRNDPAYYGGSIPFVQTGDIARASRTIGNWAQTLNELGRTVSKVFPRGTMLMAIAANVGDVAFSNFDVACPDSVVAVLPKRDIDKEWLFQSLAYAKEDLAALSTQNAQANLSLEKLGPFKVRVPPHQEQRKIAEILRTWDEAIEKLEQLTELQRSSYIGLRDHLIDWIKPPHRMLRSLVQPVVRAVKKPNASYSAISIRSHGKGTFARTVADPSSVDMDELYLARAGDLIVNITFAWEGAIALVPPEHDGFLVSHRFPTFVPKQETASDRYLRHAVRMPRFTYLLGLVSPGGAGRNRVLNKSDFLDLEIPSPNFDKQVKIADLLDTAETAIAVSERYRELLVRQKRGLMQKLLTGEWQVNVSASDEVIS